MQRLNWGCGPITPYGWVNSDIQPGPGVDVVADIRAGLPLPDEAFDYVVSIHTLPELSYADQDRALLELRRVLKPGGVLRLSLPDFDKAIRAYATKDIDYFLIPCLKKVFHVQAEVEPTKAPKAPSRGSLPTPRPVH